jgi:hypothetical protein
MNSKPLSLGGLNSMHNESIGIDSLLPKRPIIVDK